MKIAATTTMTKALNDGFKRKGVGYKAKYVKYDERAYAWYVGDVYEAEEYGDFNYNTGEYRAIVIIYPDNYYACERTLSSRELNDLYENGDSLEHYVDKVIESVEV